LRESVGDLAHLRKQAGQADEDVKDLCERYYTTMSLKHAEVSAGKKIYAWRFGTYGMEKK
jgi:hypothetical protein